MKAVVAAFNQEKALVGAFSVITNLQMEIFDALHHTLLRSLAMLCPGGQAHSGDRHLQGGLLLRQGLHTDQVQVLSGSLSEVSFMTLSMLQLEE